MQYIIVLSISTVCFYWVCSPSDKLINFAITKKHCVGTCATVNFFEIVRRVLFCKLCHIYVNTVKYSRRFSQGNTYVCMVMQKDLVECNVRTQYAQIPNNCRMSTCVYLYGVYAEEIWIKADVYRCVHVNCPYFIDKFEYLLYG